MAEVFLASTMGAEGFSRRVAIKRVLPGFSDNEAFARMFVDEAQLSSQLVHPNIVSVLDFDRDADHRLFLVMELVEGKDLDALVATGLLPIPLVIYTIGEVLRGLGYAHDLPGGTNLRGLVHRDISPHNVLLSWEGAVKVSDFGIAKARAASEATASAFIKGKPAYMSPEQANGQPLDGRSDLFAVGIMLWEMLVGRRLFVGEDTRSTLAAVLFGQVPRPRSLRGDVPKDLERVVMKLLERDLPARYATAEEAIAELLEVDDAPKAGRELLTATLAERFPEQAPVRHSQHRARSLAPGARVATPPAGVAHAGTRPDGAAGPAGRPPAPPPMPAAAIPSLGSIRNAPTATLERAGVTRAHGRRVKIGLAVVIFAVGAAATFAAVSAMSGRDEPPGDGAGSQVAVGTADAGIDAGPAAVAADAAPPVPAPADARAEVPVPDAAAQRPRPDPRVDGGAPATTSPKKYGKLSVPGLPSVIVFVDNLRKGESPMVIELPVGTYKITLLGQDPDVPYKKTASAKIIERETTTVNR